MRYVSYSKEFSFLLQEYDYGTSLRICFISNKDPLTRYIILLNPEELAKQDDLELHLKNLFNRAIKYFKGTANV